MSKAQIESLKSQRFLNSSDPTAGKSGHQTNRFEEIPRSGLLKGRFELAPLESLFQEHHFLADPLLRGDQLVDVETGCQFVAMAVTAIPLNPVTAGF